MQICYRMYFDSCGYSIAAQEYILAMLSVKNDQDINLEPLKPPTRKGVSPKRFKFFNDLYKLHPKTPPMTVVNHCIPSVYRTAKKFAKHVGFCVYETVDIPKHWVKNVNKMDHVITCSDFNRQSMLQAGVRKPISLIPHTFDPGMFHKGIEPNSRFRRKTFFAMGTWRSRKNWETLIRAFYGAFTHSDDVCLLIKTNNPDELRKMVRRIKMGKKWRQKATAPIYADQHGQVTFEEIPALMRQGDFYISCSLGEGFGLPGLHAMALGMPVVTPAFGGSLEYAKPEFTTHIPIAGMERRQKLDGISQFRDKMWPVIREEDVARTMQKVVASPPVRKTHEAYEYVHKHFTYDVIGPKFLEVVQI